MRRYTRTSWNAALHGPRSPRRRHQFYARCFLAYRRLCLCTCSVGIAVTLHSSRWTSAWIFSSIWIWTWVASNSWCNARAYRHKQIASKCSRSLARSHRKYFQSRLYLRKQKLNSFCFFLLLGFECHMWHDGRVLGSRCWGKTDGIVRYWAHLTAHTVHKNRTTDRNQHGYTDKRSSRQH